MRSLVIEHAAQIPEINPSAARFALDEMLGFVLVRISVLDNIFSARDLHSSLFNLCFPQCVSLRDELNTRSTFRLRALSMPMRACIKGPRFSAAMISASTAVCHASRFCSAFGSFMMQSAASRRLTNSRPPASRTGSSKGRAQAAAGLDRAISYLPSGMRFVLNWRFFSPLRLPHFQGRLFCFPEPLTEFV